MSSAYRSWKMNGTHLIIEAIFLGIALALAVMIGWALREICWALWNE